MDLLGCLDFSVLIFGVNRLFSLQSSKLLDFMPSMLHKYFRREEFVGNIFCIDVNCTLIFFVCLFVLVFITFNS